MDKKSLKLLLILPLLIAFKANAATYDFNCITSNDSTGVSCDTAEAQMSVDVIDAGSNQVEFLFNNVGSSNGFIADVYFYDGPVLGAYTMTGSSGVAFSEGARPGLLPAYDRTASLIFSADSDAPVAGNGIQAGEWLSITFDLINGNTYADILTLMDLGAPDGLVVGIHAQGLGANDFSESLITAVPVPAALWLFGTGLIGLLGFARRK